MKFIKMHGAGNDYIYVDCFIEKIDDPESAAIALSDRHFGIGGDGLVLIMPSESADIRMRMFNADGSEGRMCGNAIRCVGKYAFEHGYCTKDEISIETMSGIKYLKLSIENGKVKGARVDMGKAILEPKNIPVKCDKERCINQPLEIAGSKYYITCVSMGNPHAIVYVDNVDDIEIEKIGPLFENNEIFPERVNTEFIQVINEKTLKMRVWERGSGETLACGTGACASVASSVLNGKCSYNTDITVILRGGKLIINYNENGTVYMTGPAAKVFEGEVNLNGED